MRNVLSSCRNQTVYRMRTCKIILNQTGHLISVGEMSSNPCVDNCCVLTIPSKLFRPELGLEVEQNLIKVRTQRKVFQVGGKAQAKT